MEEEDSFAMHSSDDDAHPSPTPKKARRRVGTPKAIVEAKKVGVKAATTKAAKKKAAPAKKAVAKKAPAKKKAAPAKKKKAVVISSDDDDDDDADDVSGSGARGAEDMVVVTKTPRPSRRRAGPVKSYADSGSEGEEEEEAEDRM